MRLTKLEIHGFKSFADHTQLVFEPGATMIVGPNGCGKSNVSDSVRWVLGEQRARVMRGGSMQDIIFQGSSARRPVNVAEVSLHFDNADGSLPVPFHEVVITRRLSRSGESEYFLNRAPCRLRDIQDLVRGTGLGAESGVVIESRMIDALLSDRPDDRRELFEEAAGVGLYRDRRRSTERRLEETAGDLQRIDDLVNEVQSQVRSLARQRKRAERSVELSARRFNVELTLAAREMAAWRDELERLESRVADLRELAPGMTDLVDEAEQRREASAGMRAAAEGRRAELARLVGEQRQSVTQLMGEIAVAEERQRNAAQRRERAESERMEHAQLEVRVRDEQAAAAAERAAQQQAVMTAAEEFATRQAMEEEARSALAAARHGVEQADRRVREARDGLRRHEMDREGAQREMTELTLRLERLEEDRSNVRDAVGQVLREGRDADEALETARVALASAQAAHEQARERARAARAADAAARGELFRADEAHTSLQGRVNALETLERERVGLAPAAARLLEVRDQFGDGAVVGPVADFIEAGTEAALLVERFLGNTVNAILVRDRAAAEEVRTWHQGEQPGPLLLLPLDAMPEDEDAFGAPEHDVLLELVQATGPGRAWVRALLGHAHALDNGSAFVDARGAMFLPGSVGGPGPLRRRAELVALRADLEATTEARRAASASADLAREALEQADRAATVAGDESAGAQQELRHADERRAELERRRQRAERELNEANALAERLAERREDLAERIAQITELADAARAQLAEAETRAVAARGTLEGAERTQEEARESRTVHQVEQAQAQARLQVAADRERRLGEELQLASTRMESLGRELATLGQSDVRLAEQMADWKLDLDTRQATLADAEGFLADAERGVKDAYEALEDAEGALADIRRRAGALADELHAAQLRWTELNGRRAAIRERLEAEWRKPMDDLLQAYDPVELDDDSLRSEAESLREQVESLGPINPLAVEEHEDEMKRLDFLTTQRSDLAEARLALQQAIREIDTTARELFIATFHQVRENFRQIFMTLFGGGECDIKLENPDAPLDCDIEIHASPRGKRTQRIHLLSSGERALVACSLLFGIFLTRPSPFCLLDEVDAPLDDTNVGRFVRMLNQFKERTQFIVITHNPRTTTEAADAVYGVTMQEPGVSSIVSVRMKGGAVEEAIAGALVGAGA